MKMPLSMINPDAKSKNSIGEIVVKSATGRLKIRSSKMIYSCKLEAKNFNEEPSPFTNSDPILVSVLQKKTAIEKNRKHLAAESKKTNVGTIFYDFAGTVGKTAVHGFDPMENAKKGFAFVSSLEFFFR